MRELEDVLREFLRDTSAPGDLRRLLEEQERQTVSMSERLVRKVALAAVEQREREGGWIKVDAPGATDKDISLAIMEADERGLVKACRVTNSDSEYEEWRLMGPTGATQQYLRETRTSKKVLAIGIVIGAAIVSFLAWLIPVLISLWKK